MGVRSSSLGLKAMGLETGERKSHVCHEMRGCCSLFMERLALFVEVQPLL